MRKTPLTATLGKHFFVINNFELNVVALKPNQSFGNQKLTTETHPYPPRRGTMVGKILKEA